MDYTFQSIPHFLDDIFSCLSPADYQSAARVCKIWRACSRQEVLIKRIFYQCFHYLPHPELEVSKGWKAIINSKNELLRNIQDKIYHTFFYEEVDSDRSGIIRFDVCNGMNVVERVSGQNFVVNHFGQVVLEYSPNERVFDAFDHLLAGTYCTKPEVLIVRDTISQSGRFYFLPEKWKFPAKLNPRFLSRTSMIGFLAREAMFGEFEMSLCHIHLGESAIRVQQIYTDNAAQLDALIRKYSVSLKNINWRSVLFVADNAVFSVDLKEKDLRALKIHEHERRIEEVGYWNDRIYCVANGVVSIFSLVKKKIVLKFLPSDFDKVWFRDKYLFEYLPTSKTVLVTDLEKGAMIGKWSVALSGVKSSIRYTVEKIEYVRGYFFCLYVGPLSMKTVVMYNMKEDDPVNMDAIVFLGARYGCYEEMSVSDGRVYLLMAENEGVIVDFNKTPPLAPVSKAPKT